jgi:hypothetical protein
VSRHSGKPAHRIHRLQRHHAQRRNARTTYRGWKCCRPSGCARGYRQCRYRECRHGYWSQRSDRFRSELLRFLP